MRSTGIITVLISFLCLGVFIPNGFSLTVGDPFPGFSSPHTFTPEACGMFGMDCDKDFSLEAIGCDVAIVEFLNVYCHTCRVQVPVYNEVFDKIMTDPVYAGRACLLGVAAGNTDAEIATFKNSYAARYPIIPDADKTIFNKTVNIQGTPHTYVIMRDGERFFIIDYHSGASTAGRYVQVLNTALRESIVGVKPGNVIPDVSFEADGQEYTKDSFADKRLLLYFPVDKRYPVDIDTRNHAIQMEILDTILTQFPEVHAAVFPFENMPMPDTIHERLIVADTPAPSLMDTFGSADSPVIYMINPFGRVSFKGESITLANCEEIIEGREYVPQVDLSDEEIIAKIEGRIRAAENEVIATETVVTDANDKIHVTAVEPRREGIFYFSFVASKPSLCDICHDTHFIYTIDQEGLIRDFIPLKLTKIGNVDWSEEDNRVVRNAFSGKSIFQSFSFDPAVDAVTTSTMSSGLVYEAFNEAKEVFADFKDYGFRSGHWKEICHHHIRLIKERIGDVVTSQQQLDRTVSEHGLDTCPQAGLYIAVDGDVLCSIHGLVPGEDTQ